MLEGVGRSLVLISVCGDALYGERKIATGEETTKKPLRKTTHGSIMNLALVIGSTVTQSGVEATNLNAG